MGDIFEPRGSLGRYVEGLGVPLGGFGAQSLLKTASLFHARYFFSGFGAKLGTGKVSTCSPKPNKKQSKTRSINQYGFGSLFYWIFIDFWCKACLSFHTNHDPHTYQSKKAEGCKVLKYQYKFIVFRISGIEFLMNVGLKTQ